MKVYDPTALGLEITRKISDKELQCLCPYHDDSTPSAEYNIEKQVFHCFTCKETRQAKQLAKDLGGELIFIDVGDFGFFEDMEGETEDWKAIVYMNRIAKDNPYLIGRQVTDEQTIKYLIKENRDGVIFPLFDKFEDLKGAVIRHTNRTPKYYFYGEKPLFWPYSSLYKPGELVLTEGVFGAMRAESAGLNAAAILGTNSVQRIFSMIMANSHIKGVAWLDPDYAGFLAMGKLCLLGMPVILHDENIDEMSPKKIKKVYKDESKRTYDVMEVINRFDGDYERLQFALQKFWESINY